MPQGGGEIRALDIFQRPRYNGGKQNRILAK